MSFGHFLPTFWPVCWAEKLLKNGQKRAKNGQKRAKNGQKRAKNGVFWVKFG